MNDLTAHYTITVRLIEQILLTRAPRFCRLKGLNTAEVETIAAALADAHAVAARDRWVA